MGLFYGGNSTASTNITSGCSGAILSRSIPENFTLDNLRKTHKYVNYSILGLGSMKHLIFLIGLLLTFFCSSISTFAQSVDYSEAFVGGTGYSPGSPQYDNWISFRSALSASNYSSVTVSGTNSAGITCSSPTTSSQIASALNSGAASSFTCDGQTWKTGTCGTGIELTVGTGNICQCSTNAFTLRPTLSPGNQNWGGAGGGSTCSAPSQTLAISFAEDTAPPTIDVTAPSVHDGTDYVAEFEFSKNVTGFALNDITVLNGTASGFITNSPSSYTAIITPSGIDDVTVSVAAGTAQDSNAALLSNSDQAVTIYVPTTTSGGGTDQYSEDFVGGTSYPVGTTQYDNWISFRASLTAGSYNSITVSGTNNTTGISCTSPATTLLIANALNSGSTSSFTCDGQTWRTGTCGNGIELTVGIGGICQCNTNAFTLRPTIFATGHPSWGASGGGSTCNAASQNLTVMLNGDSEPPLVSFTDVPASTDGSTPFTITLTFSEEISGLTLAEIQASLANGTASNLTVIIPDLRYEVTITPDTPADITIGLAAGVVQDSSGNDNEMTDNEIVVFATPANLEAVKTTEVFDPLAEGLYALPGNDVTYTITITNIGDGSVDDGTILLMDRLPAELIFYNGDADGPGPETDPVIFSEIVGPTGLNTFDFANDVKFSDSTIQPTDMSECDYVPTILLDQAITFVCFNPKGSMAGGDPDPSFSLSFRARIR